MSEPLTKRVKPNGPLIGTHNGHFHADEALAVYMLRLLPTYRTSNLIRTRDPAELSKCDIVVDVGGEYSHSNKRYDHHQRGFEVTFPEHKTKLSSAGLVYMHYGREIISRRMGRTPSSSSSSDIDAKDDEVEILYAKLYDTLIEAVDANDNGINVYPSSESMPSKRFNDTGSSIMSHVNDLNRSFSPDDAHLPLPLRSAHPEEISASNAAAEISPAEAQEMEDERFGRASAFMGSCFSMKLQGLITAWLPARGVLRDAYASRFDVHDSGRILVLPSAGTPWKDHLYEYEAEQSEEVGDKKALFVLYPESAAEGAKWRVQAVPVSSDSFENRRGLKEEWRGLRDSELSEKSGIEGCVFVHASGFIGGNASREGALKMAVGSL